MRRRGSAYGALLVAAALAGAPFPSRAAPASTAAATDNETYHFADSADHVRIAAVESTSGSDGDDQAVVVVVIEPGYHINANPPTYDYLIPTTLNLTNAKPLRIVYPKSVHFTPKFAPDVLDVYEGTIRITAEFPQGALTSSGALIGALTAQACTAEICLPPAELPLPPR